MKMIKKIFALMMALLMRLMGIESTALHICTILLAMPVASNTASIAERYGGDYVFVLFREQKPIREVVRRRSAGERRICFRQEPCTTG